VQLPFNTVNFSDEAYSIIDSTASRINETFVQKTQVNGFDIISLEEALKVDNEFLNLAYKQNKKTILHRFMKEYYCEEWNYLRRKTDDNFPKYVYPILDELGIKYHQKNNRTTSDYNWYLFKKVCNNSDRYIHEAFQVLFNDRKLMQSFSIIVSKTILNLKQKDFPEYMINDGEIKRYTNWNKWLQDALFHREKGCCAQCGCDLTSVIAIKNKINIDHIVPISRGGTNDPTNLQILCSTCNNTKSNNHTEVGSLKHIFW
jgi:hypothetical protein